MSVMLMAVNRAARVVGTAAAGLLIQDRFHGLDIDGGWVIAVTVLLFLALSVFVVTWEPVWTHLRPSGPQNFYEALVPIKHRFTDLVYERGRGVSGAADDYDWDAWVARFRDAEFEALEVLRKWGPEYEEQFMRGADEADPIEAVMFADSAIDAIMRDVRGK